MKQKITKYINRPHGISHVLDITARSAAFPKCMTFWVSLENADISEKPKYRMCKTCAKMLDNAAKKDYNVK